MISFKITLASKANVGGDFNTTTPSSLVLATPNLLGAISGEVGSSTTSNKYKLPSIPSNISEFKLEGISPEPSPSLPKGKPSCPKPEACPSVAVSPVPPNKASTISGLPD